MHDMAHKYHNMLNKQSIERHAAGIDITPERLPPNLPGSASLIQITGNLSMAAKTGAPKKRKSSKRRSGSFNTSNIPFGNISRVAKSQRERENIHKQLKPKEERMFTIFCGDYGEDPAILEADDLSQRFQEFQVLMQDEVAKKALAARVPKKAKEQHITVALALEQEGQVAIEELEQADPTLSMANLKTKRSTKTQRSSLTHSKKRRTTNADEHDADLRYREDPAFKVHVWNIFESTTPNLKREEMDNAIATYSTMNERDRAMLAEDWENCPGNPEVITMVERLRNNRRFASWAAEDQGINVSTCCVQAFVDAALTYSKRYKAKQCS